MGAFLAGVGTKLADRWVNALLLPGLLWTALLAAGVHLGQAHAFAADHLSEWLDQLAARPATHASGTVALTACATLLAGAGVGMLAGGLGGLVERLWALPDDRPAAAWLLARRRQRWDAAERQLKTAILQAARGTDGQNDAAHAARVRACQRRRARLGAGRPQRPTRIGDRFARTTTRTAQFNGLDDLALAWPRLWTMLPDQLRTDIVTARDAYAATARLAAWGLLYLALTAAWWPAALIGAPVLATATGRAHAAADVLADLIETACDLHLNDLAKRLGLPTTQDTASIGHAITARLRTTAPALLHPDGPPPPCPHAHASPPAPTETPTPRTEP
ncbi:hypothetical protein [Streptomyces sp. NPDC097610]|uniref:hypothetical protein n=1 Tax=Streptomyces sp. NPDC097610 TaxID=3157227 RepID=UPI003325506A